MRMFEAFVDELAKVARDVAQAGPSYQGVGTQGQPYMTAGMPEIPGVTDALPSGKPRFDRRHLNLLRMMAKSEVYG